MVEQLFAADQVVYAILRDVYPDLALADYHYFGSIVIAQSASQDRLIGQS